MPNGWNQSHCILQKLGHVGWYVIAYSLSFFLIRIKMAQVVDGNFALVEDDVSATTSLSGANSDNGNLPQVCIPIYNNSCSFHFVPFIPFFY